MIENAITLQSTMTLPLTENQYVAFTAWCNDVHSAIVAECLRLSMPTRFTAYRRVARGTGDVYHFFNNNSIVFPTAEQVVRFVALLKERLPLDIVIYWSDLSGSVYQPIA